MGEAPASYIDTFYFFENSIQLKENFKRKRGGRDPLGQPLQWSLISLSFGPLGYQ